MFSMSERETGKRDQVKMIQNTESSNIWILKLVAAIDAGGCWHLCYNVVRKCAED
jgi:hypothetical protein